MSMDFTRNGGTKSRTSRAAVVAVLVVALLAASYAWTARHREQVRVAPPERVRIAATAYIGACPVLTAQENGYFAEEGIIAEIEIVPTGRAGLEAALHGGADLATVADVPIMFAAVNGEPVSVVATIATAEKDHGIVGRRDRGVLKPADLKGKRIGVPLGTSLHFFLEAFLNRHALAPAEVTMVDLPPEALAGALASGDVDAIVGWQQLLSTSMAAVGEAGAVFYDEGVYNVMYSLAGNQAYLAEHRRTVEKLLRAVIRGAKSCNEAPDLARANLARVAKTDPDDLKEPWRLYRFEVVLRQGLLLALEDETRWALKNKLTRGTRAPNYLNHISLEPLRAMAPAAVTVIH